MTSINPSYSVFLPLHCSTSVAFQLSVLECLTVVLLLLIAYVRALKSLSAYADNLHTRALHHILLDRIFCLKYFVNHCGVKDRFCFLTLYRSVVIVNQD